MTGTDVSSRVLERLTDEWNGLTPEAQKAARYVLENPLEVGVSTVREIAEAAQVKPNTLVRMARQVGFDGYDDFRAPFREAIRRGAAGFPDRARWLQDVARRGETGALFADMVSAALSNLEETFAGTDEAALTDAANAIWSADNVFALGVGQHNSNARNFSYLASTGMKRFHTIPSTGSTAIDDLAWAGPRDVLIAITMRPYRTDTVAAVRLAQEQEMTVIALSDSPASPIVRGADHRFIVPVETPQFFPSSVGVIALLEALLSFVVAIASDEIVDRVDRFHQRRHRLGLYEGEP
ncbi:MAG: MurR/RpiR family transcriptional regulator [Pseudomonadota bacterium]